ncbi:restriction endonuclease subunit S [Nocardiopsis dassonvillei]|uniref:restriction endonuclease subunit S n=1 Tax=Nocardiopsis dassonvillei TaxID=2014 RepID=UPI0033C10B7D
MSTRDYGVVPSGANLGSGAEKLGRTARIGNGSTPRRENRKYWDGGDVPWLNSAVVNQRRVGSASAFVTAAALAECHLPIVPPGSILVGLTGQGKTRGMATILDIKATVNQHLAYVIPDRDKWWPDYLVWLLTSAYNDLRRISEENGSTKGGLTCEALKRLRVTMPPVDEQRAIADYLDCETAQIDNLIEEQQWLIEMLRERRTAVVSHATSRGAEVEFRRIIAVLRQGWSPNCESWPADGVTEWGVLKVGCSNTGRFDAAENKRLPSDETPRPEFAVRRGELVMSRSNTKELVGAVSVVQGDYPRLLLSDLTYGISLVAEADPAFIAYALASPAMRVQISAASKGMSHSMQKISQRDIRELRLRLPALDEQRRVVEYLDEQTAKIDTLIAETERFIELSRERRTALITAAVTGQIDVRKAV